ncbi:MAG: 7-cyano-7-deazaguanine synthase QueC [Alphaproteobacteria bacterium]|nr:7-cyano-7-deazaguanine synthase QueC [Alphaproteobacteria bacterium]MBV9372239.1 7-cyano-7-deazaguanine synthase QueC [Alphaproteobacteria bacterium]MBV9901650.1 7-cyano-7-deazaguanine synthase QueC [Alphaproteobacteria bacterium]
MDRALVLFSGGQDSTTCLAWALDRFATVETVGFDYRQRHRVELEVRPRLLEAIRTGFPAWGQRLSEDHLLDLGVLGQVSETSLTRDMAIVAEQGGLPNTFVPGRNLLFLTLAAALAYRRGARHLVIGVCETDYSGYPDCRAATMSAMEQALNLGMEAEFEIHAPLMRVDKAGTWAMAAALGGAPLVELIRDETHSCYRGDRSHRHPWGVGCGDCPACALRANGWKAWEGRP